MSTPCCYFLSPSDPGIAVLFGTRCFNFRVELHGDHVHVDFSCHLVRRGIDLGGSRCLPDLQVRDFGRCRFRLPLSDAQFDREALIRFIQSEPFQNFAIGPLDNLAGSINPKKFGATPD